MTFDVRKRFDLQAINDPGEDEMIEAASGMDLAMASESAEGGTGKGYRRVRRAVCNWEGEESSCSDDNQKDGHSSAGVAA